MTYPIAVPTYTAGVATRARRSSAVFSTIGTIVIVVGSLAAGLTLLGGFLSLVSSLGNGDSPSSALFILLVALGIGIQTVIAWACITVATVVTGYIAAQVTR